MIKLECILLTVVIAVVLTGVCVMVLYATEISVTERRRKAFMEDNVYQFSKSMGVIALTLWDEESQKMGDRYPYVAAILTNMSTTWSFVCFGSVILMDWVVTSAHCKGDYWGDSRVLIFHDFANNRTQTYPILQWFVHEKYNENGDANISRNDISVAHIQINSELHPHSIKPAVFDSSEVATNLVDGCVWKTVSTMDRKLYLTNELDSYKFVKANQSKCIEIFGVEMDDSLICVDMSKYDNLCYINEFGPLFFWDKVVGVLTLKPRECDVRYAIFTNVSYYKDWMMKVTKRVY